MGDTVEQWMVKKPGRLGLFDDYTVQGLQYESGNADLAWHISAWRDHYPVRSYWVARQKFYGMSMYFSFSGRGRLEIHGEIENIPSDERKAILKAITEWEKPLQTK